MIIDHNVLIISDHGFEHRIHNLKEYSQKLLEFIVKRTKGKSLSFKTVSGKYMFYPNCGIPTIEIEDRTKTVFTNSIIDNLGKIDEIIIITNHPDEPFLESLQNKIGEVKKSLTIYSYQENTENATA